MKMPLFTLIFIMFLACGKDDECSKPELPICMEDYTGPLDVLWSVPIHPDTLLGNSIHPVIYEDHVLYSKLWLERENVIYSFNPETGERQWEWSELPYVGEVIYFNNPTQAYDDKFYFNYLNHKILMDIDAPSTEWISLRSFSDIRISAGKDHLYYTQYYDRNDNGIIVDSEIFRTPKGDLPIWESVYFREGNAQSTVVFDVPMEWISPNQDTLIIFTSNRIEPPVKSDLVAYNITQNKIAWEIPEITTIGETSRHIPLIRENLAYITNVRTISCVDLVNGVELWETEDLETGFSRCAPVLSDDKIIVNGSDGKLRGINLSDGLIAWRKDDSNNNPPNMAYYDGGVYYCTDSALGNFLYGLDANTGVEFYKEESPNQDCKSAARFSFGVSIDEANGKLYTLDGYFAMCIQLEPR